MSPATKAPKPKLTLRDAVDLLGMVNQYIEEHVDEIELNGGALPDDMVAILDEVDAAAGDRVDALAAKIDELTGYAESAKATKDRATRREKVWKNAIASMKRYGALQVERNAGEPLKGTVATLRLQRNGQPSCEHAYTDEQLLEFHDRGMLAEDAHPLARFIKIKREPSFDAKALAAAYDARRAELELEADLIGAADIVDALDADIREAIEWSDDELARRVAEARAAYIADNLANEFPGVKVTRGYHLRID